MTIFTVSFFGHRIINDALTVEHQVEDLIQSLITQKTYVEFLVGRDGEFDQIVSSAIRRCKRKIRSDNSAHVWVLPYVTAEFRGNEEVFRNYYDEIEICGVSAGGHFKKAYQTRNREMVDRSDFIVFCIQHKSGGAWQTLQYARNQGKPYMTISGQPEKQNKKFGGSC